jgi:hypothetical protein
MICSEPARPSTVWPEHGQGAFVLTGQAQVQAGPNITLTDADADADADADFADTDRRRRQQDGSPARPTGSCAERTHE